MRHCYLKRRSSSGGSRGGVGSNNSGDYELEVGADQYASVEMIALCSMIDEILEHLQNNPSDIGHLLLATYKQKVEELNKSMEN